MDVLLSSIMWYFSLVYLDDILVFLQTPHEQINYARLVFSLIKEAVVTPILKKCALFTNTIDYLEQIIRPGRLSAAVYNTDAIRDLNIITTKTEPPSLTGLCNFLGRFAPNFTTISLSWHRYCARRGQMN